VLLFWLSCAASQADLLVITGTSDFIRPANILRVDQLSGAVIDRVSLDTEAVTGISLTRSGSLVAAGNTLGRGELFRSFAIATLRSCNTAEGFTSPGNLTSGPDGALYVLSSSWQHPERGGEVLRFNGETGEFVDSFIQAGAAGKYLIDLTFGPNGNLFVADMETGVWEFDATTGATVRNFVPAGQSSALRAVSALAFGPDGNLYVASRDANAIFRFDGHTGEYRDIFVNAECGALEAPTSVVFSDGIFYVASSGNNTIQRFDMNGNLLGPLSHPDLRLYRPARIIAAPAVPSLRIQAAKQGVVVSWPAEITNCVLECSTGAVNGAAWEPV
jgi:outer membrane protein assembly factor BamB